MSTETMSPESTQRKKDARKEIYRKLEQALSEYKSQFKEKRFQANLKKASRIFASGLGKKVKKAKDKSKKKKNKVTIDNVNAFNGIS